MAAFTTIAALGMAGVQAGMGIAQDAKAKKELANLEVPELDNAFEDIQISTLGSDIMNEQNAITTSNMVDASKSGGVRSVMGAIPQIQAFNNNANQESRKYLDDQVINRDYSIAQDNQRIRGMKEQRYQGEVQGLGQMMATGQQNAWSGIRGIGSSLMYADRNGEFGMKKEDKKYGNG